MILAARALRILERTFNRVALSLVRDSFFGELVKRATAIQTGQRSGYHTVRTQKKRRFFAASEMAMTAGWRNILSTDIA